MEESLAFTQVDKTGKEARDLITKVLFDGWKFLCKKFRVNEVKDSSPL